MSATDRREGLDLDLFDIEEFLRSNTLAQRLVRIPKERRIYALAGIVHHKSGNGHAEALRHLLTDIQFLAVRLVDRKYGGLSALLQDYDGALLTPGLDSDSLRPIQQALDLSQYLLNDDPSQLPQQLIARLSPSDSCDVARLLDAARRYQRTALLPIGPSLPLPGGVLRRSLIFNGSQLQRIVLLPGGERCVIADQRRVFVRELTSGAEIMDLGPHGDEVTAMVYEAGHGLVAAALRAGQIPVWDLRTQKRLFQLPGHGRATLALAVTPEGDLLSGGTDGAIHVWDLDRGCLARTLVPGGPSIQALVPLPDGTVISGGGNEFFGPREEFGLHLWRLEDGASLGGFGEHEWPVQELAVTSDGRLIVSAANQTLKVWNLETRTLHCSIEHTSRIIRLRAVNGRCMVLSTDNPNVMLWDIEHGHLIRRLRGHHGAVSDVAVAPDGRRALSVSQDQTLKIWDLNWAQVSTSGSGHDDEVWAIAFTPDGTRVISASDDHSLGIWDASAGTLITKLQGHSHWVRALEVSLDGKFVYSASWDGTVKTWDLATGSEIDTLKVPDDAKLQAIAVTADGHRVAGTYDGRLFIWNPNISSDPTGVIKTDQGSINSLVSLDGDVLSVGDQGAAIWNLVTGEARLRFHITSTKGLPDTRDEIVRVMENIARRMNAVALLPGKGCALLGTGSGHLVLWELDSNLEGSRWEASVCGITDIAVTHDGRFAVVSSGLPTYSSDNTVRIWDLEKRTTLARFVGETPMTSCAISPDGRTIVVGDYAGRVHFLSFCLHP